MATKKSSGARKAASGRSKAAARRQRDRRALRVRLIAGAAVLIVLGVVVYAAASPSNKTKSVVEQLEAGPGGCKYDTKFDGPSRAHVPNPTYKVDPPAGGAHNPKPADPGFYTEGKAPTDGELVHAMEHGFVVLWYRPNLPAAARDQLSQLSDTFGRELIVVPRPSLTGEVAVTAWHKRLLCSQLDPATIELFTNTFTDQGPEKGFL